MTSEFATRIVIGRQMLDFEGGVTIRRPRAIANGEWGELMLSMLHHRCGAPSEMVCYEAGGARHFFYRGERLRHVEDPAALVRLAEKERYEAVMKKAGWTFGWARPGVYVHADANKTVRKIVCDNGHVVHYNEDGKLHHLGGPAIENACGRIGENQWWVDGKKHRDPAAGPAIEFSGSPGLYCWEGAILFKEGRPMTQQEAIDHVAGQLESARAARLAA